MSEDALSAEEQQELARHEARIEQGLKAVKAAHQQIQQAWGRIRRVYKLLRLDAYLLTRWQCDPCGQQPVIHGIPLRKRCPKCQDWMSYHGLVRPETYATELYLRLTTRTK
jgi:hypothetical protein